MTSVFVASQSNCLSLHWCRFGQFIDRNFSFRWTHTWTGWDVQGMSQVFICWALNITVGAFVVCDIMCFKLVAPNRSSAVRIQVFVSRLYTTAIIRCLSLGFLQMVVWLRRPATTRPSDFGTETAKKACTHFTNMEGAIRCCYFSNCVVWKWVLLYWGPVVRSRLTLSTG